MFIYQFPSSVHVNGCLVTILFHPPGSLPVGMVVNLN